MVGGGARGESVAWIDWVMCCAVADVVNMCFMFFMSTV